MPSYPYRTTREDLRVPLPDGTELFARVRRPVTDEPVPVVLEYSTGRLTDWTATEDARRHPWFAGHGYAAVRADARGHGNSGGLATSDPDDGAADGEELVRALAGQPWCSGRVGLLGTGAAGDVALRLAARAPDAVHAVVVACPEGPHRLGGAVLAADGHARATTHLADAARPPDPQYVGDGWRAMWLARLEALEPPLAGWLAAPPDAPVAAAAPTLAVAGWSDPSASRLLDLLASAGTVPVRTVLGPWSHGLPDEILPEALRWYDHWLRDTDTGVLAVPALRSWLSTRWAADGAWPSPGVRDVHYGLDGPLRTAGTASDDRWVHVRSPQHTGLNAGAYVQPGRPAEQPPDQREEDGRSVCFDSRPLPEPVELLGTPVLSLRLRTAPTGATVTARLCAVAPDGTSTLLTRGVLTTPGTAGSASSAGSAASNGSVGSAVEVTVGLAAVGRTVPPGHRLRLALSSTYWPWLWPGPDPAGFELDPSHSGLGLPIRRPATDPDPITFISPTLPLPPPLHVTEPLTARPERVTVHDIGRREWRTELSPATDGTRTHPDGLVRDEHTVAAYRVLTATPLSARARADRTVRVERPGIGWDATVHVRTELRCDPTHLIADTHLRALEGGDVVFSREWHQRIPR
ncbi:CocE/NonD family hydrolase [Streptomyces sp. BE303]|uniref:CocE/NonD family hydrolase n=1 Tax=Streptomyces sp. BE303 TaxID=3002528 RepID=UPI002E79AB5A|nr:CocE/NonD family hydrolase [Streptomyces sp. BE303]MED7947614.1 CocE/NonD family hydrolase [Streptomyces sp. BE303]